MTMTSTNNAPASGAANYKRYSWPELREAAKGNWTAIFEDRAAQLAEAMANAPYHVPCPVHGGNDGFRLFEDFNETGGGVCNTCGPQRSGFAMLAWLKSCSFQEAAVEVADWLRSEGSLVREKRARTPVVPFKPKVDPQAAFARMQAVWKSSLPLAGSPAERYLMRRGIWRQNLPHTLRAHPSLTYVHGKEKTVYGKFPCLLAPIRDRHGVAMSVHRIFLTEDGYKAPVPDAKKMMSARGELRGAAIKLFAASDEVLGVAEGIETALAVHAISRMPVWSCVTAGLMERVDIPDSVKHVVIWADRDRSERGLQAAESLAERLEKEGKTVEICLPQGPVPDNAKGVDWLDVMNTQGINGFPARWRRWRPGMTQPDAVDLSEPV